MDMKHYDREVDRIREISSADLDDPETRLNLAVALRVHGLLGL